jgi:hypothetical protein
MVHLLGVNIPDWFVTYELAMDATSVFVSFAVAIVAFQIHSLTEKRQPKIFGYAFLFIGSSYLMEFFINIILYLQLKIPYIDLQDLNRNAIHFYGVQIHVLLFIAGLITLLYMTFKFRKPAVYGAMLLLAGIAVFLGSDNLDMLYIIPAILLAYIFIYYFHNFKKNNHGTNLIVFVAFFLFFAGSVCYLFNTADIAFFIAGNTLELFAMLLILVNLLVVSVIRK